MWFHSLLYFSINRLAIAKVMYPYSVTTPLFTLEPGQHMYVDDPHDVLITWKLCVCIKDKSVKLELQPFNRVVVGTARLPTKHYSVTVSFVRMFGKKIPAELDPKAAIRLEGLTTILSLPLSSSKIGKTVKVVFCVHSLQLHSMNFHSSFLSLFSDAYFTKDPFTDCTVECQGVVFHAHRCVLGKASPVFASAWNTGGMQEAESACIKIDAVEPPILRVFLMVLYEPVAMELCSAYLG